MRTAVNIAVRGRVQGVGFRPFVFMLAEKYRLSGTVQNNMDGVKIYLEGKEAKIQDFLADLKHKSPRLAKITEILVTEEKQKKLTSFSIIASERSGTSMLVIPIDSAVCDDCLNEMNDPNDFRYEYPFINCTQCGPRYTIIRELPYDRPFTTMENFYMCPDCKREYEDPTNRRHHAQPIACPKCGPRTFLLNEKGERLETINPIAEALKHLKAGRIVAVKGIGGYHLCCDARNEDAVELLRRRKKRPERPLAVMGASVSSIIEFAELSNDECSILKSPESPIVVLSKSNGYNLAKSVAPGMKTIGVMLPYTPLHHLLFKDSDISCLIMTSANPSGLPILYRDDEVLTYLEGIADYYLIHNREILHPVDDSVIQVIDGKIDFLRRSRGYVPDPFATENNVSGIVAFGGQQKSTFTIGRNQQIFVGPHIGDLENMETIHHYRTEMDHLLKWIETPRALAVVDAHPGYEVQKLVRKYEFERILEVQHHHAHMAACMDEHQIEGKAFGIILDGTGYGFDGNIWGFEILYGDGSHFERMAHLHYTPLPGGEKCIREPWRNACAMLVSLHGEKGNEMAKQIFLEKNSEIDILVKMVEKGINTVHAGTCGRLFDAVSAICGVTKVSSYDGEAAIKLSELVDENKIYHPYTFKHFEKERLLTFDFSSMLEEITYDVLNKISIENISGNFHETVVQSIISGMEKLFCKFPKREKVVVLSGGSIHNRYLRKRLVEELSKRNIQVYTPEKIPCNDGGLSYGQLVVAAAKRRALECVLEFQQK